MNEFIHKLILQYMDEYNLDWISMNQFDEIKKYIYSKLR